MPKSSDSNRLPATNRAAAPSRAGQNVVREMITKRLAESDKRRHEEAFIMPIGNLVKNANQPRQVHDPERDVELAADVKVRGILEPIIVRPYEGKYQIVAGERRYRAALAAELKEVPVIVQEYDDEQARYVSLIENLQRQDLDKLDEARFFQQLINEYNVTYKELANFIHRSTYYVQERLKLLEQPAKVIAEAANHASDKNNKHEESSRLLKTSQVKAFSFKPLTRFSSFLSEAGTQVKELPQNEKNAVVEQLRELRKQLDALEKQLEN